MYQIGNIYFISALAVIGGGLFGFDISSMSAIIPQQTYLCYFNQGGFNPDGTCIGPNANTQGGITAAMPGGSWLGALISGFLTDRLGRKKAIMIACLIWIVGSILSCAAQNIGMLIVGRVINGICVGIASAQVPVYISELAQPNKRGRLVGAQQWAITWGILIMFYISYGTSTIKEGTAAWRIPWGLQMVPAMVLFVGLFFTPESPRWLARKERWEEAKAVVVLVHGKGDPNHPLVAHEMAEIRSTVEFERANKDVSYFDLLKPNMINRTHIGVFTQIWSQLTGMNVMMYYISYVFQMAGKTEGTLLLSSSIQYIINVVMTIPALLYVDRWGRRPTLLVGALLMAVWMFANAGILSTQGSPPDPNSGFPPEVTVTVSGPASTGLIACTYLFVASYAPTWGPVSWVYPPELYPMRERGKAVALATSANWAFNFALSYFVPPAFEDISWRVYCVFGSFLLAMFLHVFFLFPETAGKTLEETREMFEDPTGIKLIGTPAWKTHKGHRIADVERTGSVVDYTEKAVSDSGSPDRKHSVTDTHVEAPAKVV